MLQSPGVGEAPPSPTTQGLSRATLEPEDASAPPSGASRRYGAVRLSGQTVRNFNIQLEEIKNLGLTVNNNIETKQQAPAALLDALGLEVSLCSKSIVQ